MTCVWRGRAAGAHPAHRDRRHLPLPLSPRRPTPAAGVHPREEAAAARSAAAECSQAAPGTAAAAAAAGDVVWRAVAGAGAGAGIDNGSSRIKCGRGQLCRICLSPISHFTLDIVACFRGCHGIVLRCSRYPEEDRPRRSELNRGGLGQSRSVQVRCTCTRASGAPCERRARLPGVCTASVPSHAV